jgi:hypothetical protein
MELEASYQSSIDVRKTILLFSRSQFPGQLDHKRVDLNLQLRSLIMSFSNVTLCSGMSVGTAIRY